MQRLILSLFLLLPFISFSQKTLTGTVVDSASKMPVAGASVFLSNTSIGTTANARGEYTLVIPSGKFDLVISALDYETFSQNITSASAAPTMNVLLKQKPKELETVVIQNWDKDGWAHFATFFKSSFIGGSDEAHRCVIKNPETLRFRNDPKSLQLTVSAREPLIIENKALGYRIRYQLESFIYEGRTGVLQYAGFPLFESLDSGSANEAKWAKARERVYYGSLMHFMRSLYRNKLAEEGFQVFSQRKIPNLSRIKASAVLERGALVELDNGMQIRCDMPMDTVSFYQGKVGKDPLLVLTASKMLSGDSIAYAGEANNAMLDFADYLVVLYSKGSTPNEYQRTVTNHNYRMQSEITLIRSIPVQVESNGAFYSPFDLLTNGWWAWSEKIGMMLPLDYEPAR